MRDRGSEAPFPRGGSAVAHEMRSYMGDGALQRTSTRLNCGQ